MPIIVPLNGRAGGEPAAGGPSAPAFGGAAGAAAPGEVNIGGAKPIIVPFSFI
jgi:hypothetical protein